VEIPKLVQCKLDPSIKIIKGVEYLDLCSKQRKYVTPSTTENLFPAGQLNEAIVNTYLGGIIVVATDVLLQVDEILDKIVQLLEKFKVYIISTLFNECRKDFQIKIG
jgi:hypothetical protein